MQVFCPNYHSVDLQKDFFGRNDAKAETPVLWPPHAKSWLIGKDSDAGRDWGREEKGTIEDEMTGWHRWLDGRESEWTPGVGDGQGGLACCDSWGRKELDTTEWLIWSESTITVFHTTLLLIMEATYQQMKCVNGPMLMGFTGFTMLPAILKLLVWSNGGKAFWRLCYSTSNSGNPGRTTNSPDPSGMSLGHPTR